MVSRTSREFKAQSTHVTAMEIIAAEQKQHQLKTDRLRQLRLASQAQAEKDTASEKDRRADIIRRYGRL
jgi:hypothetical protein